MLKKLLMALFNIKKIIRRFLYKDSWSIGCISASFEDLNFALPVPTWIDLPVPWGCYVADPFIIRIDGSIFLFYERYDYIRRIGKVVCARLTENLRFIEEKEMSSICGHASYPFIFSYDDTILLIPENMESKNGPIYDIKIFNNELFLNLANYKLPFVGEDPTIYFHNEKFWLWTTLKSDSLYLFYADKISGEWIPHKCNPVKVSKKVRPAGNLFGMNGRIYRPSQDCTNRYGEKIIINEIVILNESIYVEREIRSIDSSAWGGHGVHTINKFDKYLIIDVNYERVTIAYILGLLIKLCRDFICVIQKIIFER